jgi:hypothetical protein
MCSRGASILAVPLDLRARRPAGASEAVSNGVMTNRMGKLQVALSDAETLADVPGQVQAAGPARVVVVSRQGEEQPIRPPQLYVIQEMSASPDGSRVGMRPKKFTDDIHVYDMQAGPFGRVTRMK